MDHWGGFDGSDENLQRWIGKPAFDPTLWIIAWDGDEVAGGVINAIEADENEALGVKRGWLHSVFTRRPWRKRGLAQRADRSLAGCSSASAAWTPGILGVDADNPTGALGLYERNRLRGCRALDGLAQALRRAGGLMAVERYGWDEPGCEAVRGKCPGRHATRPRPGRASRQLCRGHGRWRHQCQSLRPLPARRGIGRGFPGGRRLGRAGRSRGRESAVIHAVLPRQQPVRAAGPRRHRRCAGRGRERRSRPARHRPRPRLQPAPPRALRDAGLVERRRAGDRAQQGRPVRGRRRARRRGERRSLRACPFASYRRARELGSSH